MNKQMWLSYHIYYHSSLSNLLRDCLLPAVSDLEEFALMKKFFFLRYWEQGPHIRLRLQIESRNQKESIHLLEKHLRSYLDGAPSREALSLVHYQLLLKNLSPYENKSYQEDLSSNNSFQVEKYQPEYDKYGGKIGMEIAENLFFISSKIIAKLILKADTTHRLIKSWLMMLIGVKSFNLSLPEVYHFFKYYYQYWSRQPFSEAKPVFPAEWERFYQIHEKPLTEWAKKMWDEKAIVSGTFQAWRQCLEAAASEILAHRDPIYLNIKMHAVLKNFNPFYYLLMNYLHTHNNRYGILTYEEAFLGFLGLKATEALLEIY